MRPALELAAIFSSLRCTTLLLMLGACGPNDPCPDNRSLQVNVFGKDYALGTVTVSGACSLEGCESGQASLRCTGMMTGSPGSSCNVALALPDGHFCFATSTLRYGDYECSDSLVVTSAQFVQPNAGYYGAPPDHCWE